MSNQTINRRSILIAGILGAVAVAGFQWSRRSPQIALDDEQVVATVDALFTAISTRNTDRLEDCARRLKSYHERGQTSSSVDSFLDSILAQARNGHWDPAARSLYDFILHQRGKPAVAL
jgi:hypothetical protein